MINVLKRLTKFGQAALFAILSLAALYAYLTLVYIPEEDRYEEAFEKYNAKQEQVRRLGKPRSTTNLGQKKAALQQEIQAIRKRILDPSRKARSNTASSVGSSIVGMAKANDLLVVTQKLGEKPINLPGLDDLTWMVSTVKFRGSFAGLPYFIEALREAEWAIIVQNFKIAPDLELGKIGIEMEMLL